MYLFRGPTGEVLYVGTATDLRRRVGQYFNGADPRSRMKEMVALATAVDHVECAHALEAGVRELRLLAAHAPPYNRRSRFPHRWWWVVLTDEAYPRFSAVRAPRHDRAIGPFRSRTDAADTAELLARFLGLRTCAARIARDGVHGPACPEREVSPCPARARVSAADYAEAARRAAELIDGADDTALTAAVRRVADLAAGARYEGAARLRDQTSAAIDVLWRGQRLRAPGRRRGVGGGGARRRGRLAAGGGAARPTRRGRLGAARRAADAGGRGAAGRRAGGAAQPAPLGGALLEETGLIARWLAAPGVRNRQRHNGIRLSAWLGGRWASWAATARSARLAAEQAARADSELLAEPHPTREQLFGRPESIASAARRSPSSHDGSHSAWLASPAWATMAPRR